ncbi:MAG: hypothetical protein HKN16_11290 [Saprospiraceae bacterium]|nr:hypothetical protein [Saprospiraceae bacterium]
MELKVLGIRHHGPGSARACLQALKDFVPDLLLVEAPTEMDSLLDFVLDPDLKPPVAGLIYNAKDLSEAHYYPMAVFSPEYQGINWALKKSIPCRCVDLGIGKQMALEKQGNKHPSQTGSPAQKKKQGDEISNDPLGYLASLAGFEDRERWWEMHFEHTDHGAAIFETVLELMSHIRDQAKGTEDAEPILREAHMREAIRKAKREGFEKVAFICGAWHAPVLQTFENFKATDDKTFLKGLKNINCSATWIPWSYHQLSNNAGYSAGVKSPEWYHLLFKNRNDATIRWMTKAGRLLRNQQMSGSAAHVIEAVQLAEAITSLRDQSLPGLQDLEEAAVAALCHGNKAMLDLIRKHLVIGSRAGKVPKSIPVIPFQKDLEKQIKSSRLQKYRETNKAHWLKGTADKPKGGIDLREPNDQLKSLLLHRLSLLDITWGYFEPSSETDLGGFKEYWKLQWKASFAMRIVEAGMWGNTVESAAINFLKDKAGKVERLKELAELLQQALLAYLPETMNALIKKLDEAGATTLDISLLLELVHPLVQAYTFGSTRQIDIRALESLLMHLIPRVCIGLPNCAQQLDEDASRILQEEIIQANQAIQLLQRKDLDALWTEALVKLSDALHVHPLLTGFSTRLLWDRMIFDLTETEKRFAFGLSSAQKKADAAYWIEGFLYGSGQLIIHQPSLWGLMDGWLQSLDPEDFKEILPLLRRAFSEFSSIERERMLDLARGIKKKEDNMELIPEEVQKVNKELGFLWQKNS